MTVVLGLLAALSVGTSDFLGGVASRRANPVVVTAVSGLLGFVLAFFAGLAVSGEARLADLIWGAAAGVGLAAGLVALYAGYARTRVAIAAPVAGVGAAALPVAATAVFGDETLSAASTVGVVLGMLAIALVSMARSQHQGNVGSSLLHGFGGAVGLGLFLLLLAQSAEGSGLWPLVAARASAVAVLSAVIAARRTALRPCLQLWPHLLGIAALVTAGNSFYLAATRVGSTSVAAVLTSLFCAATVFWAWLIFREQLRKVQLLGLGVALLAVALIAGG
ncbi:MAG: EamA family transporter [Acidimicrobiaceae bacterium]|nr:EamA family transporter [Acidimicrobiaceae bacterium]MCY4175443.1 EamA family transporter [Acidimicrobiaceae bacterium]MCY4293503.1 EamA family transporter [Acidimicrobiaceae bacterium]